MTDIEFKGWPKIVRGDPLLVTITEKINGTNSCVIVEGGEVVGVQSRNRLITVDSDNFGFAAWVEENRDCLSQLGDGYHYGEWAGPGIQKNHHLFKEKGFYLFNTYLWGNQTGNRPKCCHAVPVLHEGPLEPGMIEYLLKDIEETKRDGETPEGIVVFHHALRAYTKHTIINPDGKWVK